MKDWFIVSYLEPDLPTDPIVSSVQYPKVRRFFSDEVTARGFIKLITESYGCIPADLKLTRQTETELPL